MPKAKVLSGQIAFDLFDKPKEKARHAPTWADVQKGRAKLVDVIEPCEGEECMFYQGGECVHVAGRFGYPKKRPNGMCLVHRIVWNDEEVR